jgi:hypothetical protein
MTFASSPGDIASSTKAVTCEGVAANVHTGQSDPYIVRLGPKADST